MMVEKLIIENDNFRLFLIPVKTPSEEWINFRVPGKASSIRDRYMRSTAWLIAGFKKELTENKSTQYFRIEIPMPSMRQSVY